MDLVNKYINEKQEIKSEMKSMISYLEKIQKSMPKVISELKKDKISLAGSGMIHSMANITNNDFYDHFFG